MSSSSEAFSKFEMWKNAKTPLRVGVIIGGKTTEVLFGRIDALDESASQVGISQGTPFGPVLEVEDSIFSVEPTRVTATRNSSDWLVFEEVNS